MKIDWIRRKSQGEIRDILSWMEGSIHTEMRKFVRGLGVGARI